MVKMTNSRVFDVATMGRREQCGALCWRQTKTGKIEVLLVTSRETGRWVIPKGWEMAGKSLSQAALIEAYEEAGVEGFLDPIPLGSYRYDKVLNRATEMQDFIGCDVQVYGLQVQRLLDKFPEAGKRERCWFIAESAAEAVDEAQLKSLILQFAVKAASERA